MPALTQIRARFSWKHVVEGQGQHLMLAIVLTAGALALLQPDETAPPLLGLSAQGWAVMSILLALIHQWIVAIVFRLQLHANLFTRMFGDRDMTIWAIFFLPLLIARPLTLIMTGWADTVPITGYRSAEIALSLPLLGLAAWGMRSTLVYFTIPRALGGDHFREDLRALPKVSGGVFDYTDNGMYGVVFLGLWGIALLFGSWNALMLALFQHAYIWVHMYCTETPDLRHMHQQT